MIGHTVSVAMLIYMTAYSIAPCMSHEETSYKPNFQRNLYNASSCRSVGFQLPETLLAEKWWPIVEAVWRAGLRIGQRLTVDLFW